MPTGAKSQGPYYNFLHLPEYRRLGKVLAMKAMPGTQAAVVSGDMLKEEGSRECQEGEEEEKQQGQGSDPWGHPRTQPLL